MVVQPSNNGGRYSIDRDRSGNSKSKIIPKKPYIPKNTAWNTVKNMNKSMLSSPNIIWEVLASMLSLRATKLEVTWDEVGYPPEDRGSYLDMLLCRFNVCAIVRFRKNVKLLINFVEVLYLLRMKCATQTGHQKQISICIISEQVRSNIPRACTAQYLVISIPKKILKLKKCIFLLFALACVQ